MGLGGQGLASGSRGAGHRGRRVTGEGPLVALRTVVCVQEVLGHILSRQFRGAGPGVPCVGLRGSWLVGASRRPGCCQDAPAESTGSAIGGGARLRTWASLCCGDPLALPRGRSAAGPRRASLPGGGRLLRPRARREGGASGQGAAGVTDRVGHRCPRGLLWLWMEHLWRPAHGMGYKAPDVFLCEGGAVCARGGSPGGQRVLPPVAQGVLPRVHGQVPYDTVAHTVDGRWQAAWRGRYRTRGSADYRTRRQCLCVGAKGHVPVVLPSTEIPRHPLRRIQPHETVRQVTAGPSCGEVPDVQDGRRVRGAGLLRGSCCPVRGGVARALEARGGLCDTGTVFLGCAGDVVPRWPCLLRTGGQEAWCRLGSRKSVSRQPVRGARGQPRRRLPAFLIVAFTLARGFVPRDMRGVGVGSPTGVPIAAGALCLARHIAGV